MENEPEQNSSVSEIKKRINKPGIVYLNYIPRYMTVKKVREIFSEFGDVRRLFLKPDKSKKAGKPSKFFCEGWVEFAKRKVAKRVAECLNGVQVGGKRHTPYYDALWSIKYLPKLQWSQLNEGEVYQKARKEHRMRAEIAKVKREVNFYTQGVDKMNRLKNTKERRTLDKDIEMRCTKSLETSQIVNDVPVEDKSSDDRQLLLLRKVFGSVM